jgi:hypothetical protein
MKLEEKRQRFFASMHNGGDDVAMVFPLRSRASNISGPEFSDYLCLGESGRLAPFVFIYCLMIG